MTLQQSADSSANAGIKKQRSDFEFIKEIGEGSFSTVYLAKEKKNGQLCAIKECYKAQILKEKKIKYVHLEKRILFQYLSGHPFFIQAYFTFQDEENLYFGLMYCPNGDLLSLIKKHENGKFPLAKAQFYSAEIVCALEFMHSKQIVHRDLKPENILIDENWHIRITDFGTARVLTDDDEVQPEPPSARAAAVANTGKTVKLTSSSDEDDEEEKNEEKEEKKEKEKLDQVKRRRNSFVGTAQFVSPEILQGKSPHIGTDLWSFGCVIFQMITGKHLFSGNHEYDIFQKVNRRQFTIPDDFDEAAKDLINRLVVSDPEKRLGASTSVTPAEDEGNYEKLKQHAFFTGIDWSVNLNEITPP